MFVIGTIVLQGGISALVNGVIPFSAEWNELFSWQTLSVWLWDVGRNVLLVTALLTATLYAVQVYSSWILQTRPRNQKLKRTRITRAWVGMNQT